jgi:hypothetical protein
VAVVRGGGEEQAVLEARGELAGELCQIGVDGVALLVARGGDVVGLVEHQHALAAALAEGHAQGLLVFGAAQGLIGDDESPAALPGVGADAALAADPGDVLAVDDLEAQAEAALHLALPLQADGGGADDQDQVEALAEEQLLQDEAGLDGLAEADVVGDEGVRAREGQHLL